MAGAPRIPEWLRKSIEVQQGMVERAQRWVEDNQTYVDQALELAGRAQGWLDQNRDEIADFARRLEALTRTADDAERAWRDEGFGYVVEPLGFVAQLLLAQHARPGDENELWDVLESALRDDALHEELAQSIGSAELLEGPPAEHLLHGLNHARSSEWIQAWPPLIIGLEGSITEVAISEGLAVRDGNDVYLADESGLPTTQTIRGVEHTLRNLLDEVEPLTFLIRHVFGGTGNPFRHGAAREEVRDEVLGLTIGVVIWLDYFTHAAAGDLLVHAIFRDLERRQESDQTD